MAKIQTTPQEQKAKLINQLKDIESKINKFDEQRAKKIGVLAKKYRLIGLPDIVIENEFKEISKKHKITKKTKVGEINSSKKNS